MIKVDFYSVEVRYTGDFDSYTREDWKEMAMAKCVRCDAYDETVEVETWEEASALESEYDFVAENAFPCNKLAIVKWAYIREEECEPTDENNEEMDLQRTIEDLKTLQAFFEEETGATPLALCRAIELLGKEADNERRTM